MGNFSLDLTKPLTNTTNTMANDATPDQETDKTNPHRPAIMNHFQYDHLREGPLRDVSKRFCELANTLVHTVPPSAELSAGLRKLLEAKDCAVRAAL